MFKKPVSDLKTSAPLRSSDRRKLKQRVLQAYPVLQAEEGDILVPDGLQSQKFCTHLDVHGIVYLSSDGDPLWFTIGKGSEDLIPSVYTLWKRPDLLPFLSTPAPVVSKLIGGADLMIPGVVQHSPSLVPDQLVSVTQFHRGAIGPPLAVGRMAVSDATLRASEEQDVKGKAIYILHTWKDALWEMGASKKAEPPAPQEVHPDVELQHDDDADPADRTEAGGAAAEASPATAIETTEDSAEHASAALSTEQGDTTAAVRALTPEDVTEYLRGALLHAIATSLSNASFPIPASVFWSSYVMPARPAFTMEVHGLADAGAIDVKHSTFKNVKSFLKSVAKEGLVKVKETKGDIVVTAVFTEHPAVLGQRPFRTVGDVEAKIKKEEDREKKVKEAEEKRKGEFQVAELWKPFNTTVAFFVAAEKDTSELYSITDIKETVNAYITSRNLINANDQQYINVGADDMLAGAVANKGKDTPEFMKRDEVLKRVRANMQTWHEIRVEGREPTRKKGEMKPISVVVKIRQGRKACTLLTGYESFGLQADELAEELRKACASSTSVAPVQGKSNALEVMVQGKQIKAVTEMLVARGVPKQWIEGASLSAEKKKK